MSRAEPPGIRSAATAAALILTLGAPGANAQVVDPGFCAGEARERVLSRRRAPLVAASPPAPGPEGAVQTPLQRLLGADGNIEVGTLVDFGGLSVLMDNGQGVVGNFAGGFSLDVVQLSRFYFQQRPDSVDNLSFLPRFNHLDGNFHVMVRNSVQGINKGPVDDGAVFGSASRLQSIVMFNNFTSFPFDPAARINNTHDSFLSLMAHEFGHRFGAYVRYDADPRPEIVEPSFGLLGRGSAHWCFFLDSQNAFTIPGRGASGSSLEGNNWVPTGASAFVTGGATDGYSPLDLYVMGFLSPQEVAPFTLLENAQPVVGNCGRAPASAQNPVNVTADSRVVTIDDVIEVEGARVPDHIGSQKLFNQQIVVVARPDRFPSPQEIAQAEQLRLQWPGYFHAATGQRASVDTFLNPAPGPARAFAFVRLPDVIQAGVGFSAALLALDENGRVATGYQGTVRFSSSDPAALVPPDMTFQASDRGYRPLEGEFTLSVGGAASITATDIGDSSVTGTRSGFPVEDETIALCLPDLPDETSTSNKPWGVGNGFRLNGGIRFQYLLNAASVGRPGFIRNLDWQVNGGPDGVEWENLVIVLAHKTDFSLSGSDGDNDPDANLAASQDITTVLVGRIEQRGLLATRRLHAALQVPFAYNGVDHLLVDVSYSGGGPAGLQTDIIPAMGTLLFNERIGPNAPVPISNVSTVCLGVRVPAGDPPTISDIAATDIGNTSATITWRTSPSTVGEVRFGMAGGPLDRVSARNPFTLTHAIPLQGLTPETTYEFVVSSQNVDAQTTESAPATFTTTDVRPVISELLPASVPHETIFSWVDIVGENLFDGLALEVLRPLDDALDPGVKIVNLQILSVNHVRAGIQVLPGTPDGPRRLRVTNPDGFQALSPGFMGVALPVEAVDMDSSGRVDGFDLGRLARSFGFTFLDVGFDPAVDLDGDGDVDGVDLARLAAVFGAAP